MDAKTFNEMIDMMDDIYHQFGELHVKLTNGEDMTMADAMRRLALRLTIFNEEYDLCRRQLGKVSKVEPVRWVFDRPGHYKCPKCHVMWSGVVRFMRYCPNCGVPMDGIEVKEHGAE